MTAVFSYLKEHRYFKEIEKTDVAFFLLVAVSSAFLYGQIFDMPLTLMQARDLISAIAQGRFFDFYDIVMEKAVANEYHLQNLGIIEGANYNIVLYLILAILILPWVVIAKLFHLGLNYTWMCQYMELILLVMDVLAGYLVARVCEAFGFGKRQAKQTAYLFLTSFLLVFSTVGFNQVDIFYIVFLLLAMRCYAQDRDIAFALWMSVSILFKIFPVFLFIPMILLKKKGLWQILIYGALGFLCNGIFHLLFGRSEGYTQTKEAMDLYYHFTNRMTDAQIPGNIYPIPVFLVGFVLLCVFAYVSDGRKNLYGYVVFSGLFIYGTFFMFVYWHPQWACILALFICLAIPVIPQKNAMMYLETAFALGYFAITYLTWFVVPAEMFMVNGGILPLLFGKPYNGTGVAINLAKLTLNIHLYANVVLVGSALAMILLTYYALRRDTLRIPTDETAPMERSLVYLRSLPLLAFNALVVVAYVYYY